MRKEMRWDGKDVFFIEEKRLSQQRLVYKHTVNSSKN